MHVLLVGPAPAFLARHHNPWLVYTTRALRRLGCRVTLFPYREAWPAVPGLTQKMATTKWGRRFLSERDRLLIRLARRIRPDLILVLKDLTLTPEQMTELKKSAGCPVVNWWVDDPWQKAETARLLPLFDHVFVFDRSYLPRLHAEGVRQTHFLPCACDETVCRPLARQTAAEKYSCDLSFVGSFYPERAVLVRALSRDFSVRIWGGGWKSPEARRLLEDSSIRRGPIVSDLTAVQIYSASKMGLNHHHSQSRLGGLNMRAFELLASGLLPLTDRIPGMEELLEPDREAACYRSPEEAVQVARRYLEDPAERSRIIARGRERVLSEHTYLHRLRTLLQQSGSAS